MRNARFSPVLLALAVLASPASGQTPDVRAQLEALRAELAAATDSSALLAREAATIAQARVHRDSTLLHLELGFIAYRLGEVTGERRHYDAAAGEFEWAADLAPDWPYPWYGLGLSELALGEHPSIAIENVRQALGKDFLSKAANAFARAAAADPSFAQPVIDLADAARRQRVRQRLDVAQRALRAAAVTSAGQLPALQLARGLVEREMGEGDSALAAFDAYLAVGGDRGVGLLERARTLFYLRRPDQAERVYFAGAEAPLLAAARTEYRSDLLWIFTPEEQAAFDSLADGEVRGWLERFWAGRDARDVRAPGERLAEHYRRYFYAWRHFRLVSRHRRYTMEPYRSDQELVDDRGVIYIRHGEPDDRARFVGRGDPSRDLTVEPNESWLYRWPDGDRVFHFVARDDVQDYKLIESLADMFGPQAIGWQAAGSLPPLVRDVYESRASLDPEYRRIAVSSTAQATALANERRAGRDAVREGTTTDSYVLRFDAPLQARVQLYAVGGSSDQPRGLLVFAVPGSRLVGQMGGGGMRYPLEVRVGGRAVQVDTLRIFRTDAPLTAGQFLSGTLEFALPAATHELRVAVLEPGGVGGDVIDVHEFAVPDFRAGGLVMSDLVLGDRESGLQWIVSGDTVPLSPRGAYAEGGAVELYYELHGLSEGARYRARIEVRGRRGGSIFARIGRLFGGGPPVAFSFDGVTTGSPHRAMQTVGLAPLEPGEYVLSLEVEDLDGRVRQRREVPLRVVGR